MNKLLAVSLSLSITLAAPGPAAWAQTVRTNTGVPGGVVAPLAGAVIETVVIPNLDPRDSLASSAVLPSQTRTLTSEISVALNLEDAASSLSAERYPILDVLQEMQKHGVDLLENVAPDQLLAAAQTLPEGPAKNDLLAFAQVMAGLQGGRDEDIQRAWENSKTLPAAAEAVSAGGRFLAWAAKSRLVPSGLRKAFERRMAAQPLRDPKGFEVPVEKLRWIPDLRKLPASTKDIPAAPEEIVGQDRALSALDFWLRMPGEGSNLYVAGPEGSGRETAVKNALARLAPAMPTPTDLVQVTNLSDPDKPIILDLPPGKGPRFKSALDRTLAMIKGLLPQLLASKEIADAHRSIYDQHEEAARKKQAALDAEVSQIRIARRFGLKVEVRQTEPDVNIIIAPTLNGKALSPETIEAKLAAGEITRQEWARVQSGLQKKGKLIIRKYMELLQEDQRARQAVRERMAAVEAKAGQDLVYKLGASLLNLVGIAGDQAIPPLSPASRRAAAYLKLLLRHIARNYRAFLPPREDKLLAAALTGGPQDPAKNYQANVLATNTPGSGAPVVFEKNPTFERLFGAVNAGQKIPGGPALKGGSFLAANGGYLVLNVMDALRQPGVWQALMQALRNGVAEIAEGGYMKMRIAGAHGYEVPARVKVVFLGSRMLQMLIDHYDEDFKRAFGGRVEFESRLDIAPQSIDGYLRSIKRMVQTGAGQILDLTRDAIGAVLELGAEKAESNEKLTARFGILADLLRQATQWARQAGREEVTRADIDALIAAKREWQGSMERRYRELYVKDIFKVESRGSKVGQFNGVAVLMTPMPFGVIMRKTVGASVGPFAVASVDRNADMTGRTAVRALETTENYLRQIYGKDMPLATRVTISNEQSYNGYDGDSGTGAEMVVTEATLAETPLMQRFFMTGSADQYGYMQAIGGINEKISGVFDLVRERGELNTEEPPSFIMPESNLADLALRPDIVSAVREGKFKIYSVRHVSEAVELATGAPYAEVQAKAKARLRRDLKAAKTGVR